MKLPSSTPVLVFMAKKLSRGQPNRRCQKYVTKLSIAGITLAQRFILKTHLSLRPFFKSSLLSNDLLNMSKHVNNGPLWSLAWWSNYDQWLKTSKRRFWKKFYILGIIFRHMITISYGRFSVWKYTEKL